ncbi:MAG TPA: CoA ester lyase [Hellea balneolensis]|uniref:CoA ester lyase n=1 Tax=Hellea balneolensis TaxID=287478 RepID=A0A7C5LZK8_9PROT|nr:CoA ester lyase [Hellea balneolensis]
MIHARSLLFVPGNRAERFEKAVASGADMVVIDLEDAVGPDDKDKARQDAIDWLRQSSYTHVGLRINGPDTDEYVRDLEALNGACPNMPFVMLPKPDSRADIEALDKALPGACGAIAPVMESGAAMLNAADMFAHPRLTLALFGGVDFSVDIGSTLEWEALLYARSHLAVCAAAHNVHVFDVPYLDVRDGEGCLAETRKVKALGIPARAAIHPAQIEPIHEVFTPTEAEIDQAKRVMSAYEAAQGGVALLDGKLIEAPIMKKAKRILALGL